MAGQFLRYRARYTGASASSSLFNCLDPPVDIRTGVSETPGWSSGDVGQKADPPLVVSSLTGPHLKIALQITIVDCRLKPVGTGMRYQWLTLAALSWPAAAVAQTEDCPLPPDGNDISVFVEIPEYSLSHALSAAELTAQFGHLFPDDARVDGIADIGEAYADILRGSTRLWNGGGKTIRLALDVSRSK